MGVDVIVAFIDGSITTYRKIHLTETKIGLRMEVRDALNRLKYTESIPYTSIKSWKVEG